MRQLNSVVKAVGGIAVVLLLGYLFYFGGTDLIRNPRATATAAETKPAPAGWAPSRPDTLAPLVEEVKPAVVNISTTQAPRQQPRRGFRAPFRGQEPFEEFFERFFGGPMPQEPRPQQSLGSGFIIDKDGYILTNNHVIENAGMIMVKLANEKEYEAKVIGRDPRTDLALIKINARGDLPVVRIGDSDSLQVGDWVLAIGNPFGLGQTVTAGIVSAKGRVIGQGPYDDFIQTDAAINPGNSGGPLFNTRGEVVGINTAIFSQSGGNIGIGFAVPVNIAKSLVPQLKAKGRVSRGWLGVSIGPVTDEAAKELKLKDTKGALVMEVVERSPADRAGLQQGDVIVSFDGKDVAGATDLPRLVGSTPIGKEVSLRVIREARPLDLKATIREFREDATPS
ncbi:MAG: Do family serine endopeptidase [Chloroflexi bacterium]|nr:Do family serine endopeptidase [Chloroflexota bacterium]